MTVFLKWAIAIAAVAFSHGAQGTTATAETLCGKLKALGASCVVR